MLDLSFELGLPAHELAHRLPQRELVLYQAYAAQRLLPARRIELQLAQLALILARGNGSRHVELSDFLFGEPEQVIDEPNAAEFFGFNPQ